MKKYIVIIGRGRLGAALGGLLKGRAAVDFWDVISVPKQKPLSALIPKADFVFLCIPSSAVRSAAEQIKPFLKKKTAIVFFSKGIEQKSCKTMDVILSDILPSQHLVYIGGPMLAEELDRGVSCGMVASSSKACAREMQSLFDDRLHLEYVSDIRSVMLAGILKNIHACLLGIADGLAFGENGKGRLVVRSLEEMKRIIAALGGDGNIAYSAAGLGDLIATGFSQHSANRCAGESFTQKGVCTKESEGTRSLQPLMKLLRSKAPSYPLLCALHAIIYEKKDPRRELEKALDR